MIEGSERQETFTTLNKLEMYEDLILHSLPPLFNKHTSKLSSHGREAYSSWTYLLKNAQDQMSDSTQPEKVTRPTESCLRDVKLLKARGGRLVGTRLRLNKGKSN